MSTISASTTSTTAYKVTADTTGTLVFQTGSTPTTAMTLGSDQSVTFAGTPTYSGGTANGVAYLNGSKVFTTGTALVFDGTNLGVGTSSPTAKITLSAASGEYLRGGGKSSATVSADVTISRTSSSTSIVQAPNLYFDDGTTNNTRAIQCGSGNQQFWAYRNGWIEDMRIDTSGNLLVGTASQLFAGFNDARVNINTPSASYNGMKVQVNGGAQVCFMGKSTVDTYYWGYMLNAASGNVGTIACNSTTTSYNTSSDYRLKENIAPMTGALGVVSRLKPCTYNWKADGSEGQGFIAHELQEVLPEAVTGEKDATRTERYEISPAVPATYDEEGNVLTPAVDAVMGEREIPAYQGIDTSFLVATLTAAIQELKAELDAAKADIATLKGAA